VSWLLLIYEGNICAVFFLKSEKILRSVLSFAKFPYCCLGLFLPRFCASVPRILSVTSRVDRYGLLVRRKNAIASSYSWETCAESRSIYYFSHGRDFALILR